MTKKKQITFYISKVKGIEFFRHYTIRSSSNANYAIVHLPNDWRSSSPPMRDTSAYYILCINILKGLERSLGDMKIPEDEEVEYNMMFNEQYQVKGELMNTDSKHGKFKFVGTHFHVPLSEEDIHLFVEMVYALNDPFKLNKIFETKS